MGDAAHIHSPAGGQGMNTGIGDAVNLAWQVHVYGEARAELTAACVKHRLPLHAFAWSADMQGAGFKCNALYLIRPDGHIALAVADGDPQRLRDYLLTRYGDNNLESSNSPHGNR